MARYWLNPPRMHIITWMIEQRGYSKTELMKMKLMQLRAIWHKEMIKIFGREW